MGRRTKFGLFPRAAFVALATAGVLGACGSAGKATTAAPKSTSAPSSTSTSTTAAASNMCPLTGTPAPDGKVPQRPALAIKVENLPEARPQYGLTGADVVYEEPVEGGITRFIAIYQCHDSTRVEPVRSGRMIDPEILSQYGAHPLLGYAGGIDAAVSAIDHSGVIDLSFDKAPGTVYWRDTSRVAPHNLETSTSALYNYATTLHGPQTTPPPSPFSFGAEVAGATPASSVHIGYQYSDVTYTWQPTTGTWLRSYGDTGVANQGNGGDIAPANIIVQKVNMYPSQYVEDPTGSHENLLTLTGTGSAEVLRNGTVTTGTWSRPTLESSTTYLNESGKPITLAPGQTWIELVPNTVGVNVTP